MSLIRKGVLSAMVLGAGGALPGTSQVSANTLVIGDAAAGSITVRCA